MKSKTWKPQKVFIYFNFFIVSVELSMGKIKNLSLNFKLTDLILTQINKDTVHREAPIYACFFLNDVDILRILLKKTDILVKIHLTTNFVKKETSTQLFFFNIAKILRTPILKNICEQLFLYFRIMNKFFLKK